MSQMFFSAVEFNANISLWNTARATAMVSMFSYADAFEQDLSAWCVPLISDAPPGFAFFTSLAEEHQPDWGTCSRIDCIDAPCSDNSVCFDEVPSDGNFVCDCQRHWGGHNCAVSMDCETANCGRGPCTDEIPGDGVAVCE